MLLVQGKRWSLALVVVFLQEVTKDNSGNIVLTCKVMCVLVSG